jgi:hypothetical protein
MANVVISAGYGKENFKDSSVSLSAFAVEAPFVRTLVGRKFPRVGNTQAFPVTAHPDINGILYLDTVEVPEGVLIMIQASHRFKGSGVRDGSFFFRARHDGPMHLVKALLPSDANALVGNKFVVLQGRGDVISAAEAVDLHKVDLRKSYIENYFDEEEIASCFLFDVTDPGVAAQKLEKIELSDGSEAVVSAGRTARRIRIR